jgi:hypothetical protein
MSKLFGESQRQLQRRFDTERLADRIEERLFREKITAEDRAFIERMDMFFLATADAAGRPNCSYKGGDPGFVRVLDDSTIAFPNYDGNGMYLSMGNVTENAGDRMCPRTGHVYSKSGYARGSTSLAEGINVLRRGAGSGSFTVRASFCSGYRTSSTD